MAITPTRKNKAKATPPPAPSGTLPARMRVLYISGAQRTGSWLAEAFASDSASEVLLEEAAGATAGVTRLREEAFDAVLISHEPGQLDALELIEGLRGGGADEPVIVLGAQSEQEMAALCFEVGADAYVCVNTTMTRTLIWLVARATERHRLVQENHRLKQAELQRLRQEHNEAERLLADQRALVDELEHLAAETQTPRRPNNTRSGDAAPILPTSLIVHYRELLRASIIMGSGSLAAEMTSLADLLASAGLTAPQCLELHVLALEEVLAGLGSRSSRHVMNRADLLVLEVMVHLAEGYRARYEQLDVPAEQRWLPGFAA
ncbi:MAG: response regulator [Pirellulales bacterium]|nr:response regulator [Pirellulales bacterium]